MADNKRVLRQTITIQSNKDFNYKMSGYYVVIQEQYTCNVFQKNGVITIINGDSLRWTSIFYNFFSLNYFNGKKRERNYYYSVKQIF